MLWILVSGTGTIQKSISSAERPVERGILSESCKAHRVFEVLRGDSEVGVVGVVEVVFVLQ